MAWVNAIIQGILTGGLYALFACGLSLMFGVMKVVNLAHGDLAVIGAYVALGVITVTHIPALWSFLIVVPIMAVIGYGLQRTLIQAALAGPQAVATRRRWPWTLSRTETMLSSTTTWRSCSMAREPPTFP